MPVTILESVEAILDEAENKIRDHSRLVLKNVVAIGEALVGVKSRVPPGRYTEFATQRLGWTERNAQRFVSVYQMFCKLPATQSLDGKTDNLSGLDDLRIPISAVYLLAQPSTPEEIRAQVLEKAAEAGGISLKETIRSINEARLCAETAPPMMIRPVMEEQQFTSQPLSVIVDKQTAPVLTQRDMVTCAIREAEQRLSFFETEFVRDYGYIGEFEPIRDLLHVAREKVRQLLHERSAVESTPNP
jgi:hypothetical protein